MTFYYSLLLPALLLYVIPLSGQEHAWVYFKDKPQYEEALSHPISILTQRALDRKQRHHIPLDYNDVPIYMPYLVNLKSQSGITVKATSRWMNCAHIIGSKTDISNLITLDYINRIVFADKNIPPLGNVAFRIKEDQTKFEVETEFNYGASDNQVTMLKVDYLHQQNFTGEGIWIAVLDSGFPNVLSLEAFQRLRDKGKLLGGYDFVLRSEDFAAPTSNNHGTLVLSCMGGYIQDSFVGTAPDASYFLFRTEDASSETPVEESYWVEAAERADSLGVDIINSSLGYTTYDNPDYSYSPADMDGNTAFVTKGANMAIEKGILVVNSAGNDGNKSWGIVGAPADGNVFTVGAVTATETYASFSSGGPTPDGRIKPDVMAQGANAAVINSGGSLVGSSGTSFSSPIMAGALACFWQAKPDLSNTEVMQLVRETGSMYNNPNDQFGYGIPDFSLALNAVLSVDTNIQESFLLYPNPTSSDLYIKLLYDVPCYIQLIDMSGKVIRNWVVQTNTQQLNISEIPAGMYLFRVEQEHSVTLHKIIKQ